MVFSNYRRLVVLEKVDKINFKFLEMLVGTVQEKTFQLSFQLTSVKISRKINE
jgi:hypothetical protein